MSGLGETLLVSGYLRGLEPLPDRRQLRPKLSPILHDMSSLPSERASSMFTGLVEEMGTVRDLRAIEDGTQLSIAAVTTREGLALGDSVAVDGTCLTMASSIRTDSRSGSRRKRSSSTNLDERGVG